MMIGTAFSALIRLELAGPGIQYLQGDHQLFNGAPSHYAPRWEHSSPPTLRVLWCKASDLGSSGQLNADNSMSEKGPERMVSSYNPHGEVNKSLQLVTQVIIPGTCALLVVVRFCVKVGPLSQSGRRAAGSSLKTRGLLTGPLGATHRNSGTPERGNSGGVGGSIVGGFLPRYLHTSPALCAAKGSKGARAKPLNEPMPAGLANLRNLTKANLADHSLINTRVIDILADKDVLLAAYSKIKSNPGNMTPGADSSTLDGTDLTWFEETSRNLKTGAFQFKPSRRLEIPKPNGGTRPLGVASPKDKIVQEAMRMILEAVFEPAFSTHSHGFRPNRSCHTALGEVKRTFTSVNWFIEGDISKCFDSFDHKLIISAVQSRIKDQVFIDILHKALKAGYIQQGKFFSSELDTPQGSTISPILCNILMHQFDVWMMSYMETFNVGERRKANPEYRKLARKGELRKAHALNLSPYLGKDFKRLKYVRYADDFLIGVVGSKEDCENIRSDIARFLSEQVKLDLNLEKTKITHATTEMAVFLGTLIRITPHDKKPYRHVVRGDQSYLMKSNTSVQLLAPIPKLVNKLHSKGLCSARGNPTRWTRMIPCEDNQIVDLYKTMWTGLMNYYSFADNYGALSRIFYILKYSCVLTLAAKHKLGTKKKTFQKYGKCLLITRGDKVLTSFPDPESWSKPANKFRGQFVNPFYRLDKLASAYFRTATLLQDACALCQSTGPLEMHHIKHLKDLKWKDDRWSTYMSSIRRKQIPVCRPCHQKIHRGEYDQIALNDLANDQA